MFPIYYRELRKKSTKALFLSGSGGLSFGKHKRKPPSGAKPTDV